MIDKGAARLPRPLGGPPERAQRLREIQDLLGQGIAAALAGRPLRGDLEGLRERVLVQIREVQVRITEA